MPSPQRGNRHDGLAASRSLGPGCALWQGRVLDGLDLTVNRGETVAILGRNGAGKYALYWFGFFGARFFGPVPTDDSGIAPAGRAKAISEIAFR